MDTRAKSACSGPTRALRKPCRDADVNARAIQASARGHQGRYSSRVGLERGKGATAISPVEQRRERLEEPSPPRAPPPRDVARPREQREAAAPSLAPIRRVCVQTHSRASLFHRKNKCHLYQMAMDFQHKLNTFLTL